MRTGIPIVPLNERVDFECGCNCLTGGILPRPGSVQCGDRGLEFILGEGARRMRMPWDDVTSVVVDIFRSEVRGLDVHTNDGQVTTVIPAEGPGLVRAMGTHLPHDLFIPAN